MSKYIQYLLHLYKPFANTFENKLEDCMSVLKIVLFAQWEICKTNIMMKNYHLFSPAIKAIGGYIPLTLNAFNMRNIFS